MDDNVFESAVQAQLARVREFSDARLLNTIDQSDNFNEVTVEAAKRVALEKDLVKEVDGSPSSVSVSELYIEAKRMLVKDFAVKTVFNKLIEKGAKEEDVLQSMHKAALAINYEGIDKEKRQGGGWIWFVVFLVILNLLRTLF